MAARTFGSLDYADGYWTFRAEPDVSMRLKRIFPRVKTSGRGSLGIKIADTIEVARDILWVLERWPMEMSSEDEARLTKGGAEFDAQTSQVHSILSGTAKHADMPLKPSDARDSRAYQRSAYDLLMASRGLLLADELGLGKTVTALLTLSNPELRPMLAVTIAGASPRQWVRECKALFPSLYAVEVTKGTPYDLRDEEGNEPDLIVMTYAKLPKWVDVLAGRVRSVVFDEAQELRNPGSQKHNAAQVVARHALSVEALSGTPVQNYAAHDTYSIYQVVRPDLVGDRFEFAREWCNSEYGGIDKKAKVANPAALHRWLVGQGAFLRRTTEDVGIEIPETSLQGYEIDVDPSEWDSLVRDDDVLAVAAAVLDKASSPRERWKARGEFDYRLRHQTGVLKAPYVADAVRLILEGEEKVILAGWHRDCWDIWQDRLEDYRPVMYTGSETSAGKRRSLDRFTEGDSRILMLSLRSGAAIDGIQFTNCKVTVFGELDWSPGVHKQVLGRTRRPGQKQHTLGLFCHTKYGSDPVMLDTLDIKSIQAEMLVSPGAKEPDALGGGVLRPRAGDRDFLAEMAAQVLKREKKGRPL